MQHNNRAQLRTQFHTAVHWNTVAYVCQRAAYTILHIYLYYHIPTTSFVAWTSLLSIIYITIYMCDAGLRKSIPLYIDTPYIQRWCLAVYSVIGIAITPIVIAYAYWLSPYPIIDNTSIMLYLIPLLVISQTLLIGARIVHTSQFNNRSFAYINTLWLAIEVTITIAVIEYTQTAQAISICLASKAIFGSAAVVHAMYTLPRSINTTRQSSRTLFTQHTTYMWGISIIRSLSERNVMMPVLAWIAPPDIAAIYKIVHDAVMMIYRTLIKSIDINDITILRDARTRAYAFFQLSIKLINWCTVACCVLVAIDYMMTSINAYHSLLLVIGYSSIIEVVISPWDRLREITYDYRQPMIIYTCAYMIPIMYTIWLYPFQVYEHVFGFICAVYGARLLATAILLYRTMHITPVTYPWRYAALASTIAITIHVCFMCL